MPYKCLSCETIYDDFASEVGKGCSCGSRLFFYLTQEKLNKIGGKKLNNPVIQENREMKDQIKEAVNADEENEMEKNEIRKKVEQIKEMDKKTGIVVDFETIKFIREGKYSINIKKLFGKKEPRIYKLNDGKYVIDFDGMSNSIGETL